MSPARAVFERISVGDRLAHRDRRDRDHPPPPLRPHRRARPRSTSRSTERQFSSNAARYWSTVVRAKSPAGGPPAFGDEDVDAAERVARVADEPGAPSAVDTSATIGTAPRRCGRGRLDRVLRAAADRDVHAFGGERRRDAEAEPLRRRRDRRTPAGDPEIHGPPACGQWMGRQCRAATGPPAGAQRDDLGADRDRGLLGRAGADVEADRRHAPGRSRPRRVPLPAGARTRLRACGANPSRRGSRPRSPPPPTIAGTSNLWSWVSTHTASRGPSSSPTFAR